MKRSCLAVAAAITLATLVPSTASSHHGGPLQFGKIQYDSPGLDTRTNKSLNAEYFTIRNTGAARKNLKGVTVRDAQNHVYKFSTNFYLAGGKSVVVHTGKGTNTSTHRYWGRGNYVWNNTGDTATMRSPSGDVLDRCRWTRAGPGYKHC